MKLNPKLIGAVLLLGAVVVYTQLTSDKEPKPSPAAEPSPVAPSAARPARGEYPLISGDTTLMEMPRLSGLEGNYYITHHSGSFTNYSLEYDAERRHARWVCFSFTRETAVDRVPGRSEAWQWDPNLPEQLSTERLFKRSGYTRGHLVASSDRQYSPEANAQTFYYSNMSPQLEEHNAGVWKRLEQLVQRWARQRGMHDILYVAKGGTIADGQIEKHRIADKIVIPRYYWMALLLKKGGEYRSIAFLTEHRSYDPLANVRELALSVNELERFTGLDLFYHLPDDIEEAVEGEDPNSRPARQLWWGN